MKQQIKQYRALNDWFYSPLGRLVADEFCDQLQSVHDQVKGETLLQLGHCGNNSWLDVLYFHHKYIVSPFPLDKAVQLESSFNQLPFSRDSLDCVLVPLTLEPFGADISLMDEIDRILKPMGYIILFSINPWSIWGGAMKFGWLDCYGNNSIKMRTPFQINRILLQRGYRQYVLSNFCYIPPVNRESVLKKLTFFDEAGKMLWPFPSGLYCYIAQKYQLIHPSLTTEEIIEPVSQKYKPELKPAIMNCYSHRHTI